jgi:serine/threonine-protein kinase
VAEVVARAPELRERFEVESVLGAGGMGVVLLARERGSSPVAVKVVREPHSRPARSATRLLREARLASTLTSPHAVRVFEAGTLRNGTSYLVMEYLQGLDLARRLARGRIEAALAVDVIVQACDAIGEAHAAGIVHRDLKPSNLFLVGGDSPDLAVKVLDFGIARRVTASGIATATLTESGEVVGSPSYMAPEQLRGAALDGRADIWALGVILYEALSGVSPFRGANVTDTLVRIASERPVPLVDVAPSVPPGLAGIVETCLEKEKERRPASVTELVRVLAPYATARSQAALASVLQRDPDSKEPSVTGVPAARPLQGWLLPASPKAGGPPHGLQRAAVRVATVGLVLGGGTALLTFMSARRDTPASAATAPQPSATGPASSMPAIERAAPMPPASAAPEPRGPKARPPVPVRRPSPPAHAAGDAAATQPPPEDPLRLDLRP